MASKRYLWMFSIVILESVCGCFIFNVILFESSLCVLNLYDRKWRKINL